ncbi:MAG TPA: cytochrome b/b6 domain-containing protein [Aromatoleum sp.]|uniref:cytochrome b/b6 domain-containing protein n=1 Tax=Aromatoleum sp. TaxID=2307007 RepID=UPI002B47B269|nr:cytochrome b/b6 domain-containing protein [Aromatoleum sp.]HJV28574.1 cytochrome b/b6 domain-containing protein [Aromatoleum sp.]
MHTRSRAPEQATPRMWRASILNFAAALLLTVPALVASNARAADQAPSGKAELTVSSCVQCHGADADAIKVPVPDGKPRALRAVDEAAFRAGVHGRMNCVDCHTNVADNSKAHQLTAPLKLDCGSCHEALWQAAQKDGTAKSKPRLENVVRNLAAYRNSFHARPDTDHPDRPKASCDQCHDTHTFNVPAKGTAQYAEWRKTTPALCGESCHEDQLEDYSASIHGVAVLEKGKTDAAVCVDCHTTHEIENTSKDPTKLLITSNCGSCHEAQYKSYHATYHGQVQSLGYAHTAKCFDCHGSHGIVKIDDPKSKVSEANRLETCKKCHDGKKAVMAAPGFTSFAPHGHGGDFAKYPQIWLAAKGMAGLLIGTFAFFWVHLLLWLYRELKERAAGRSERRVKVADLGLPAGKHFRRFGPWERLGHLLFAVSLMILTLTGMTLMYAETAWAPVVVRALGGPKVAAVIHRVNAVVFISVFVIHLLWVIRFLVRNWKTFRIFGPESVVPNLKDLQDVIGMFRWFFGKGPQPTFERWTYWEKFDYWAPFWGVTIVGVSGFMMWFPTLVATYLPGWVFNVAVIAHGEEAFLAAVFLFTVHFFNNHFRPDKLPPPDIVMFTGTLSLDDFRRHHREQYERLLASGELEKHLVDAPSKPMTLASKLLGLVLIGFGLVLLVLVGIGFFSAL